jgi:uncharacterized RDD family membrane protein YckC
MSIAAGWYRDPADPDTQRYWDGEQWLGERLPAGDVPPPGPLAAPPGPHPVPVPVPSTAPYGARPDDLAPGITVGVPAGLAVPGTLAPVIERLAARIIDGIVLFLLNVVVNGYFVFQLYRELAPSLAAMEAGEVIVPTDRARTLSLVISLVAMALWFAYEVPAIAATGQTLGKRLVGVRVVMLNGEPLGFGRSIQRWAPQGLPLLFEGLLFMVQLLDAAWCLWDKPYRQCLHDKLAGTVVVAAPSPAHSPRSTEPPT